MARFQATVVVTSLDFVVVEAESLEEAHALLNSDEFNASHPAVRSYSQGDEPHLEIEDLEPEV